MILELSCAVIVANAIHSFPLEALIDEVSRPLVPPGRYVRLLDRDLAEKYLVSDILPRATFVRSLAHHTLISDDAHCKIVRSQPVILATHDLRRHVPRSTTGFTCVVWGENSGDAEIGQAEISLVVKHQVFWLNIPMDDQLRMDSLQGMNQASYKKSSRLHRKLPLSRDVVPEISTKE